MSKSLNVKEVLESYRNHSTKNETDIKHNTVIKHTRMEHYIEQVIKKYEKLTGLSTIEQERKVFNLSEILGMVNEKDEQLN